MMEDWGGRCGEGAAAGGEGAAKADVEGAQRREVRVETRSGRRAAHQAKHFISNLVWEHQTAGKRMSGTFETGGCGGTCTFVSYSKRSCKCSRATLCATQLGVR